MAEQKVLPHGLSLKERKELSITGVTEVVSFDEETVVLRTGLGTLIIQGSGLHLNQLSQNGGQVEVSGTVSTLVYQEPRQTGGLRRLFK